MRETTHEDLEAAFLLARQAQGLLRRIVELIGVAELTEAEDDLRRPTAVNQIISALRTHGPLSRSELLGKVGAVDRALAWRIVEDLAEAGTLSLTRDTRTGGRPKTIVRARQDVPAPPEPPRIDVPSSADGEASSALN
jgi:hypothetical protein